jgi:hypothetical protein
MQLRRDTYRRSWGGLLTAEHDLAEAYRGWNPRVRFSFRGFGGGPSRSNNFNVIVDWDDLVRAIECLAEQNHEKARLVRDVLIIVRQEASAAE